MTQSIVVELNIDRERYLQYYRNGRETQVLAVASDGRRVRFPARILQPFVLHQGVHGRFRIDFDDQGRFRHIVQLR
ncbi:hypothetical protein GCM10011348_19050 [Marinobacterium nitratireducens]|uniref:Topoisomerase II n=1 Tax=Marinobacterium nitratireducens TaxID=518897 RepID=A0A917ZCU2_9GAMM|nr:DUF2835 domain-containing protein [Marinobacterium nitratireducens]GGO81018.1 hypothetical protein GCM10011348_19050 [Marinobacterium nitratireducens]